MVVNGDVKCSCEMPKNPFVCPKISGFPRSIPILFGWDWNSKNPILPGRGSTGFLGNNTRVSMDVLVTIVSKLVYFTYLGDL